VPFSSLHFRQDLGSNLHFRGENAITEWLKQCKEEIPAKPSKQPRLYSPFPGFATTHGFYSKLTWDVNKARLVTLPDNLSTKRKHFNRTVKQVVEAYVEEVTNLLERLDAHVVPGV
jgi:hypothetical protein